MERGSRTRLATAGILAVVFGSGTLLGIALDRRVTGVAAQTAADEPRDTSEAAAPRRTPLYAQVSPTDAQQVRIDSIIRVHRGRIRELRDEFKPRYDELEQAYDERQRAVFVDTRESIMSVLTPEQASEYRRLAEEWDRRQAERRERDK